MGNRLSKIYTRTGDNGTTGLSDGSRVTKDHARIHTIGDVDELNCIIGIVLSQELDAEIHETLIGIQHTLFNLGGELSLPGHSLIQAHDVSLLEQRLDQLNQNLEPLKNFILPGGTSSAAFVHLARAVSRRAERSLITLNRSEPISEYVLQYVNRLSDYFFVLARHINKQCGQGDVLWQQPEKPE